MDKTKDDEVETRGKGEVLDVEGGMLDLNARVADGADLLRVEHLPPDRPPLPAQSIS